MIRLSFLDRDIGLCSIFAPAAAATGLSGAATAGISIAAIAAEELIRHFVGQGRKAADKWVQGANGQDAFKKNVLEPASIIAQSDPQKASELVSQAWTKYLESANAYAATGKNAAQVIKQNLSTPAFMQTVQSLMGRNPLGQEFTSTLGPAMTRIGGIPNLASIIQSIAPIAAAAAHGVGGDTDRGTGDGLNIPEQPAQPPINTNPQTLPGGAATPPPIAAPQGPSVLSRIFGGLSGNATNGTGLGRTLLGAIPGVIGGILQSRSIGNAADAQTAANDKALDFLKEMYQTQQANQQPWLDAGKGALTNLTTMMAPGGDLYNTFHAAAPENTPFVAPTAADMEQDPGWKVRLARGQQAIEHSQASKLGIFSGAATKRLLDYNQDSASQEYQNVYQRRFGENQQAYADRLKQFELGQQQGRDTFNQTASVAGLGQTAANNANAAAANFGQDAASNATNQGNIAGAAGVAQGNIVNDTLSNVGNTIQGQLTLQQLMQQMRNTQTPQNRTGYA